MLRNNIDYLRKKQNIPIIDLVCEVCSESMYYQYLMGKKNLSKAKVKIIKNTLGADELTSEEIDEYRTEFNQIIDKMMKYNFKQTEFLTRMQELKTQENQFILTDELVIDYLIIKILYSFCMEDMKSYNEELKLFESLIESASNFQKLHFYQYQTLNRAISVDERLLYINKSLDIMAIMRNKTNFGYFYYNFALAAFYMARKDLVSDNLELAEECFKNDVCVYGLIKTINMKVMALIENDKYDKAIVLLKDNIERCQCAKAHFEEFTALVNLVSCFAYKNDENMLRDTFNKIMNKLGKYPDYINYGQYALSILSSLFSMHLNDEIRIILPIMKKYCNLNDKYTLKYFIIFIETIDTNEKMHCLEEHLLPSAMKTCTINFYRLAIEELIEYYEKQRKYKKACEYKTQYLDKLKDFYSTK